MSVGTLVTLAIVAAAVGLAVRSMVRDKKNGKSLQCGGDCSHCGGHCH
ncbi:MAG: FeoB-associated Cys-rich membrane protein [Clostridium sp.]|nr:FeoB-associated Cys-rich membrane protein [Lachnoclostridium sp.]MCM1252494.1 FeoB-associated Cys-rich membrane protein [Clostridium sp.]